MAQQSRPKKPIAKKTVKKTPAKPKPTPSKWQGIWQVIAYEIAGLICITAAIIGFFELGIVGAREDLRGESGVYWVVSGLERISEVSLECTG